MVGKLRILGIISLMSVALLSHAQWTQIGNGLNGNSQDRFGYSVSLSTDGSVVAAGGIFSNANGTESGQTRVYSNQNGIWVQMGSNINGEAADDRSGYSVSLNSDGSVVAIGAIYNEGGGMSAGHVRVFEFSDGSWKQKGNDIDGNIGDKSGTSVSLNSDGTIIAIGASANSTNGLDAGHAKIYKLSENNWVQVGNDINGYIAQDILGISVSISSDGSIVAVGASQYNNNEHGGYARIFKLTENNWTQLGDDIKGDKVKDNFGFSVDLNFDGSVIAVGAPQTNSSDGAGYAKIYNYNNGSWTQMGRTLAGDSSLDWFGYSLSLNSNGNTVSIGAPLKDEDEQDAGSVTTYIFFENDWVPLFDPIKGENYSSNAGYSVCLSQDSLIVAFGEPWDNADADRAGRIRIFAKSNSVDVIELPSDLDVSIYPNPTSGRITIEGTNIKMIEIVNPEGQVIKQIKAVSNKTYLNLNSLSKGLYFIKVLADERIRVNKLIIE